MALWLTKKELLQKRTLKEKNLFLKMNLCLVLSTELNPARAISQSALCFLKIMLSLGDN